MKDFIDDILETARFKSAVYFKHGFCGDWGMDIGNGPYAQFHFVSSGRCVVEVGKKSFDLYKGDIILFPKGSPHEIKSNDGSLCISGQDVVMSILNDEPLFAVGEVKTHLICGTL